MIKAPKIIPSLAVLGLALNGCDTETGENAESSYVTAAKAYCYKAKVCGRNYDLCLDAFEDEDGGNRATATDGEGCLSAYVDLFDCYIDLSCEDFEDGVFDEIGVEECSDEEQALFDVCNEP